MLFESLNKFIDVNTPGRVLVKLKNYIDTLNTKRELMNSRYSNEQGYESNAVRLLRKILADADINILLRKNNDLDSYADILQYTVQDLNNIFDTNATGLMYKDVFVRKTPTSCEEIIIPVSTDDPFRLLPFNKGWSAWKYVKPVRLVDINSNELTFNTYQDQIVFKSDYPSRAIFTIDVVALVLQYVNYVKTFNENISVPVYIHQHVLTSILEDLENMWLRNRYLTMLDTAHDKLSRIDINTLMTDSMYGSVGLELPQAMEELHGMLRSAINGSITPLVVLSSLLMSTTNIPKYLSSLLANTIIPELRQYTWVEYLRDATWLDLLMKVYGLNPNFLQSKNFSIALNRDIPIYLSNNKISRYCHSANIRQFIETDIQNRLNKK